MTPLLSGLSGAKAPISGDAPAPAVDVLTDAAEPSPVLENAGFAASLEQVFAEPLGSAWPVAEDWQQALPDEPQPSAEELGAEAEQWLANVFGQLDTQVQVRETSEHASDTRRMPAVAVSQVVLPLAPRGSLTSEQGARQVDATLPDLAPAAVTESKPARASVIDDGVAQLLMHKLDPAPVEPSRSFSPLPATAIGIAAPVVSEGAAAQAPVAAAERALSFAQVPQAQWGERMIGALRDSVELQFRNGLQQATIRLDPAELGRVEIQLSHESGRLQVHIQAGQADVVRLLQQTSERLRQELLGQTFVDVSVQVGADNQQERRGRQGPPSWVDEPVVQAAQVSEDYGLASDSPRSDVLITV